MSEKRDVKKIYGESLEALMENDENICVVDIDLMRIAGSGSIAEKYPDRHFNAGIAEQDGVSFAAGLACMGKTVFVSTFCGFMGTRASDQCLDTVCYNELNVKLLGTYAGVSSAINGGTHISITDLAAFRSMPGMYIADIADGREMSDAILLAAKTEGPVYLRIPKGPLEDCLPASYRFMWGKGLVLSEISSSYQGKRAAVITSGITTAAGIEAVRKLAEEGIEVTHIHMGSIKPIDKELLLRTAQTHDFLVTADNHSVIGGLGSAVCEAVCAEVPVRTVRLGVQDVFCEGMTQEELMARHGIDAAGICDAVINKVL